MAPLPVAGDPLCPGRLGHAGVRPGDVTLQKAVEEAAAHFTDGSVRCEEVTRYSTPELGYVVQIERDEVELVGHEGMRPSSLRATLIFRRDGEDLRVVHRHADAILTHQSIDTVVDK